jgi:uncharacterized membrane protein YfcA
LNPDLLIIPLLLVIAFLYSSVGHGGASGYLGLMVLIGISPAVMRPSALLLNLIVSSIAAVQFYRSGYFRINLLIPFVILSVPFSFIGAKITLEDPVYKIILGICLLISVLRMVIINNLSVTSLKNELPFIPALIAGACIGLISGMIGIGGGILLSPLLLIFHWADIKESAAVAAPFILVNSLSGIAGLWSSGITFPPQIFVWIAAASAGGILGSFFGSVKFNTAALKFLLSAVILVAVVKLILN